MGVLSMCGMTFGFPIFPIYRARIHRPYLEWLIFLMSQALGGIMLLFRPSFLRLQPSGFFLFRCLLLQFQIDKLFWPFEKNGSFSIKSAYKIWASSIAAKFRHSPSSSFSEHSDLWRLIWNIKSLPKVKMFLWQCNFKALPVKWHLWRRKCCASSCCPVCGLEPETIEHMLLLCPWTSLVWKNCPLRIVIKRSSISRIEDWMFSMLSSLRGSVIDNLDASSLFSFICWSIWKARNHCLFEEHHLDSNLVIFNAISSSLEFQASALYFAKSLVEFNLPYPDSHKWEAPCLGRLKIN